MSSTARRWVLVLCLVILVIGALAAIVAILAGGVTVPGVTGKTQAEATKALEDAGLKLGKVTQTSDAQAEPGTVLLQDPVAGTDVDEGTTVALTVSSGPGSATVPDVVGMDRASAEAALADAGFVPASVTQYDLAAPAGRVVDQLPAGGEQATDGSQVGLLVSRGRPEVSVSVPDVTGMTADEATATLADAALVAVPVETYVADVAAGDVAGQEPAAGDRVAPLSEVLVTVSLGAGTTTVAVPDLVGQKRADAIAKLEAAGLVVTTAEAWSSDIADGVVIAQAPEPGVKVEKGGDAGILVSLGPLPTPSPTESGAAPPSPSPSASVPVEDAEPPSGPAELTVTLPDLIGMNAAQAQKELTKLGLRPVPLEAPNVNTPEGIVYAQLPAAGVEVPKTYPVLLLVSTGTGAQVNPL